MRPCRDGKGTRKCLRIVDLVVQLGFRFRPDRKKDENWNLTAKEKVCADSFDGLNDWALAREIEIVYCRNCNPMSE